MSIKDTDQSTSARYAAVDPDDQFPFQGAVCRALYIGAGGDVHAVVPGTGNPEDASDGNVVAFYNVPNGTILPIQTRWLTVDTSAGSIVALY